MLETLKAERIPCKLSEMQMGSVVENTWKKLSAKVLPSLTAPGLRSDYTGSSGVGDFPFPRGHRVIENIQRKWIKIVQREGTVVVNRLFDELISVGWIVSRVYFVPSPVSPEIDRAIAILLVAYGGTVTIC